MNATASVSRSALRQRINPLYVYVIVAGITAQFMSGMTSEFIGVGIPLDRMLLLLGGLLFLIHPDAHKHKLHVAPAHLLVGLALLWCLGSMIWFGGIRDRAALFTFLDAYGVVPMALAVSAPVIFSTAARRRILLTWSTVLGIYLGWTALMEGLHAYLLVWPSYIVNPDNPHFGRALGPSQQAGNNGLTMMACGVSACILAYDSRGRWRALAIMSAGLCGVGMFFTLTRSIWLGAAVGIGAVACIASKNRLRLLGASVGLVSILGLALLIPSVGEAVTTRASDSASAFDRLTAADAAYRVIAAHPVAGVGYQQFPRVEDEWVWHDKDRPVGSTQIAVHNVLLGYAAELGLVGAAIWLSAICYFATAGWPRSRAGPDMRAWRLGVCAYTLCWIVASMLLPISYSFPTTFLWLGFGIVALPERLGYLAPGPVKGPWDASSQTERPA